VGPPPGTAPNKSWESPRLQAASPLSAQAASPLAAFVILRYTTRSSLGELR
jgi:hypothetical protein